MPCWKMGELNTCESASHDTRDVIEMWKRAQPHIHHETGETEGGVWSVWALRAEDKNLMPSATEVSSLYS